MTQWILSPASCTCAAEHTGVNELESVQKVPLCQTCGKKLVEERKGSLTQWIMSEALCRCSPDKRIPVPISAAAVSPPAVASPLEEHFPEDENELEIDENHFPIKRYKPISAIGKGNAGAVFLARDRFLGKLVAVKVLHDLHAELLISFQTEARALAIIKHGNIVELLDFGPTPSGLPYMVLEYFPGITLAQHIQTYGPLKEQIALDVFSRLAEALEMAHSAGIYHRDLSASNLLVRTTDTNDDFDIKLIDFGVAKLEYSGRNRDTQGKTLAGTPAYMPPDVANGLQYDARSEIYSLGCILFESLTGVVPFSGQTPMETLNMHAQMTPPMLQDVCEERFSIETEAIVSTCLEKNPDDRFQTMASLRSALLETREACAEVNSNVSGQKQTREMNPHIALYAVAGLLVLGLATTWFYMTAKNEEASRSQAIQKEIKKQKAKIGGDVAKTEFIYLGFDEVESSAYKPRFTITGRPVAAERLAAATRVTSLAALKEALDKFPNPTYLKLYDCVLNEEMVSFIEQQKTITDLNIRDCRIPTPLLKRLTSLHRLLSVRLNHVSGSRNAILNLRSKQIQNVEVRNGGLDEKAVAILKTLPEAVHIEISKNKLSHQSVKELAKIPSLNSLFIDDTGIDGSDLAVIATIPNLYELSLTRCGPFKPSDLEPFLKHKRIKRLWLNGTGTTPAILEVLKNIPSLTGIDLADNPAITAESLKVFAGRDNLEIELDRSQVPTDRLNAVMDKLGGPQLDISNKSIIEDE